MADLTILRQVLRSDEQFFWHVTGSIADLKYNPLYWFLTIITLGFFIPALYYKRTFTSYSLTSKRLLIISDVSLMTSALQTSGSPTATRTSPLTARVRVRV